jgi:hypothetical protein
MSSKVKVSAKQNAKKNLPSRYLERIQKKIMLGNVQVSNSKVLIFAGPRYRKRKKLNPMSGRMTAMLQMTVVFIENRGRNRNRKLIRLNSATNISEISRDKLIAFPPH